MRLVVLLPVGVLVACGGSDFLVGTITSADGVKAVTFKGAFGPKQVLGTGVACDFESPICQPVVYAYDGKVEGTTFTDLGVEELAHIPFVANPARADVYLTEGLDDGVIFFGATLLYDPPVALGGPDETWRVGGTLTHPDGLDATFSWTVRRSAVVWYTLAGNGEPPPAGTPFPPRLDALLSSPNLGGAKGGELCNGAIVSALIGDAPGVWGDRAFTLGTTDWTCDDDATSRGWCHAAREVTDDDGRVWTTVGAAVANGMMLWVGGWASDGARCDVGWITPGQVPWEQQ